MRTCKRVQANLTLANFTVAMRMGFEPTHSKEGKCHKEINELLYQAGHEAQGIYKNLVSIPPPVGIAGDDNAYKECVYTLNAYFYVKENVG